MDSDKILERAFALKQAGQPFALATVVHSRVPASAKAGAKAIIESGGTIHGWIGGGCAQPAVIDVATRALSDGRPYLVRISPSGDEATVEGVIEYDMHCHSGGTLDIFVEPVLPRPRLLILGTSEVAQALGESAGRAGFAVTAAAPGVERALFPHAEQMLESFELESTRADFIVVATQGKGDEDALEAALRKATSFITLVASRRKAAKLKQYLHERGHDPERVESIVAPAGLDIGAVTPGEIAVSVLAALIQRRREAVKASAEAAASATPPEPRATDPVCRMSVDPRSAEHTFVYEGTTYYFCCAGCRHEFEKTPAHYASRMPTAEIPS